MKTKVNVIFTAFEAAPFIKTGGLGDVGGALPPALNKSGCNVKVILPKLSIIPEKYKKKMEPVQTFTVPLSWRNQYCGVEKLTYHGVTFYFLDNKYYFERDKVYGHLDDCERVAFFSKAVLESILKVEELQCDILHCNDWHTALVPVFLREFYMGSEKMAKIKTVFSVHNLKFQGIFSKEMLGDVLGLDSKAAASQLCQGRGAINLMKGALLYSDVLSTVSPTYAEEIKSSYFGEKMEGIFNKRSDRLFGILNGIDTAEYNPQKDKKIPATFDKDNLSGKAICKVELQRKIGLEVKENTPLIILITRLTEQKGLDLILRILDELLQEDIQIAVLGTGDEKYENALREAENRYKGKMCAYLAFDSALSHLFYAGADLFMMPSRFEPCGLSQMIAMRYGTLPVVRETGGLKDSVIPYNKYTGEGTGFSFSDFNAHQFLFVLKDAIGVYLNDKEAWNKLVIQAMETDVSWKIHAKEYADIYKKLMEGSL